MATPSVIQKPKDLRYINDSEMGELLWWSIQLGASPEKLLTITRTVGKDVVLVKNVLKKQVVYH